MSTASPDASASTEPASAPPEVVGRSLHEYTDRRSNRLYKVLAWIGIIAGIVFIVAVIFFSGVFFGRAAGGYHGWHRGYQGGEMGSNGSSLDDCPMMRPGGMMGPGGMGPGGMGPGGMMGPQQSPSTGAPTMPRS